MINAYGLTETTITSTLFEVGAETLAPGPSAPVPVGRPLPHAQVLVLDEHLNPVPPGAVGEIYIGGCGVARGYLGQPELTAERFVPSPRSLVPGARMYRSGDLGRWREDPNLEDPNLEDPNLEDPNLEVGRADRQVKIRGFRVEPAEIEHALAGHPGIAQVAVLARDPGSGDQQVTAPVQAGMSHLWSTVLKTSPVSLDDDFFERGGNSLLAAEMPARARVMFGISSASIRALTRGLLRDPTLRGFANATQAARAGRLTAGEEDPRVDFAREAELDQPIHLDPAGRPDWQRPGEILLTGATGFFGCTCSASSRRRPPRGSTAWSGRTAPLTRGGASLARPSVMSSTWPPTASCRCPVTSRYRIWA